MTRIGNLFRKDLILGIKDVFIILELVFAIIIMFILLVLIPGYPEKEGAIYIYDTTKIVEDFVRINAAEEAKQAGEFFVDNRDKLIEGMTKDKAALGMIIKENSAGTYDVELLTQPYTIDALVKYIALDMEDLLSMLKPPAGIYPPDVYTAVKITSLQWGVRDDLPFNKRLLPPIILMMVGMIGLFAMISLTGQERGDATIQAFKVTPASIREFLFSKHLVLLATSIVTFSILYLPLMGFRGYPQALLIMILTVLMGSSIGVILGGFFDNPMGGILWVLVLMIVLNLPVISLFAPVFSPGWLKFIPSYHILFGLDAAMFPDNNSQLIWQGVGILAVIDVLLFPLSGLIFSKLIRKEA